MLVLGLPTEICYMPGSVDIFQETFRITNNEIEDAVNSGNFNNFHGSFGYLNTLSKEVFDRYINEGSYYPALSHAMQKGEFKKVVDALEALKEYPRFETPMILVCKAACLLQLGERSKCWGILEQCKNYALIDEMIASAAHHEQLAYKNLRSVMDQPRT